MQYTIGQRTFSMPEFPIKGSDSIPYQVFHGAMDEANKYALLKYQVESDNNLSNEGKRAKLSQYVSKLWSQIFVSAAKIQSERKATEKRVADLYAIGQPTTVFEMEQEKEIRQWWQSAPVEKRKKFRSDLSEGNANQKILLALLRSPIPEMFDLEMAAIKAEFEKSKREQNRGVWASIKDAEDAVDWAARGMAHVTAHAYQLTEKRPIEILKSLVKAGNEACALAMGFAKEDIEREKLIAA